MGLTSDDCTECSSRFSLLALSVPAFAAVCEADSSDESCDT